MQDSITTIIAIHNLTIYYDKKPIIKNLNAQIPAQKMCCIIGPNGSGKTTLLKSILGIIPCHSGSIQIAQKTIHNKCKIAYVPQKNSIDWTFPINVFDVVMMGRYGQRSWWQNPNHEDKEIVLWALQQVEMTHLAHHHISTLSGGQQQRIFLARALAQQADIFILDEPFSAIDVKTEELLLNVFDQLKSQGKSIILVHHDLNTVLQYFDWTLLMHNQQSTHGPTKQIVTTENIQKFFFNTSSVFYDHL